MSLTFKLLSLAIRTAAKPIGNYIKRQAKEHDGFRAFAVNQAQRVHRIDMRMRLGILHDQAAQDRMHEREQRAAEEKKRKADTPTVRTAEEQKKFEEAAAKEEKDGFKKEEVPKPTKLKIRPLSEARAIELGANFFSEAFIFGVAAGLLIWDSWRSRKKESARRDDVAERLEQLEAEVESLRAKLDPELENLHDLGERVKAVRQSKASWWDFLSWRRTEGDAPIMEETKDAGKESQPEEKLTPMRKAAAAAKEAAVAEEQAKKKQDRDDVPLSSMSKPVERIDSVAATKKER